MRYLLLLSLLACTPPRVSAPPAAGDRTVGMLSSVRIRAFCGGELSHYGSGVAVSEMHVLTAKHVVECDDGADPWWFDVVTPYGQYEATLDIVALDDDVDAARLLITGTDSLLMYANTRTSRPKVGEAVWMYAGDGSESGKSFYLKDGYVSMYTEDQVIFTVPVVPGNSGGAVFDLAGNVTALLWGGSWAPHRDRFGIGWTTDRWSDLIPVELERPDLPDV